MLEVIRDYFDLTPDVMFREIQGLLAETEQALLKKGIRYGSLKTALVPDPHRREVALVFDTSVIEEAWYGLPIHTRLLPLLSRKSNHSVLVGDYIGPNQDLLYEAFAESVELARDVDWRHGTQFYIVYINNLTDDMVASLRVGLEGFEPYVGLADVTYASRFKLYLSMCLVHCYLQYRGVVIMGHEDDVPNDRDVNMAGYPFDDFGFRIRSLQDQLFSTFLAYKIERAVFPGLESDTEFSLNAVDPRPSSLSEFGIEVELPKFDYLRREKAESLKGIGLLDGDAKALERMILEKLSSNYIYNVERDDDHDLTKFNIILEGQTPKTHRPFRVMAALEYMPHAKRLRLLTLF